MDIYLKFMTFLDLIVLDDINTMQNTCRTVRAKTVSVLAQTNWVTTIKVEPDPVTLSLFFPLTLVWNQLALSLLTENSISGLSCNYPELMTLSMPGRFWNNQNSQLTWSNSFRPILYMLLEPRQELGVFLFVCFGFFFNFPSLLTTRPDIYLRVQEKCVTQSSCFCHALFPLCIHSHSAIRVWYLPLKAPAGFNVVLWHFCPLC